MTSTRTFGDGCIATPHHVASTVGAAVLARGGNAVDAAVAANLVLAVVTPYHCGLGGDLLALVYEGSPTALTSIGAAPAAATSAAVREAAATRPDEAGTPIPGTGGMPSRGVLSVTVPGAVAGWAALLERFGSRSFGDLAAPAIDLASDGFVVSQHAMDHVEKGRVVLGGRPDWSSHYGQMAAGRRFVQTDLAATLTAIAKDGPDVVYRGRIGEQIVETLAAQGSAMTAADLAAHTVDEVELLRQRYRELEVLELPPPTQGVTALTALGILEAYGPVPDDDVDALHVRIEAVRAALADRQRHVGDPATMQTDAGTLLDPARLHRIAAGIDLAHTGSWLTGRPAPGGTAYLCAADRDGRLISLIQSNFMGFGSGVVVGGTGIGLHNRGAHFSLDPDAPNVLSGGRKPLHTLIPAMAMRDGAPALVFGTMGGDGQAQTHVQLLTRLVDGDADLQTAIDAPRWFVDPSDGTLAVERGVGEDVMAALRARGHAVRPLQDLDHRAGHAHAIAVLPDGFAGASDPRCEGAVLGR